MAHRIRGVFANARNLSYFVVRIAVAALGHGAARQLLESPSWGTTESPPLGPPLSVECEEVAVPGCPFDLAPSSDGRWLFVSLQKPGGTQRTAGSIAVLHRDGGGFRMRHQIPLAAAPWGLAWARGESLLAVANSHGVVLLDAEAARNAGREAIVGTAHYGRDLQTIRVLESPDGRWLLASDEHNATVSVLDLSRAAAGTFDADALVNQIPVDLSPLGMALSSDGKHLYVTCEMQRVRAPDLVNWFVWAATLQGRLRRAGVLYAIDMAEAAEDPTRAIVARVPAGGHPVRICMSQDGQMAWVTARASNQLLAFSMRQPGAPTCVATTPVGPAAVGLTILDELGVVLVANSNRFGSSGGRETVGVIDVKRALAGQKACLGHIRVGCFPREVVVDRRQRVVYVTNFDSGSLTVISLNAIQHAVEAARAGLSEQSR